MALLDLVGGNFGLNHNLAIPAGEVGLFIHDFDQNKNPEAILTYERAGATYTFASKDELVQRMVAFRKRFPKYRNFASKSFYELFDKKQIEDALRFSAEEFRSCYFENDGQGNFTIHPLPRNPMKQTQFSLLTQQIVRLAISFRTGN